MRNATTKTKARRTRPLITRPLVAGGQGRSASEVSGLVLETAAVWIGMAGLVGLIVAIATVGR